MITFISSALSFESGERPHIQFFTLVLDDEKKLKLHHHCKNVAAGIYPVPQNVTYLDIRNPGDTNNANLAVLMNLETRQLFGRNLNEWYLVVSEDQKLDLLSKKDVDMMKNL